MAAEGSISAKGASGTQYKFDVYRWGTPFRPIGGVYLVLKKQPNKHVYHPVRWANGGSLRAL
jgi:hypothetical protein